MTLAINTEEGFRKIVDAFKSTHMINKIFWPHINLYQPQEYACKTHCEKWQHHFLSMFTCIFS